MATVGARFTAFSGDVPPLQAGLVENVYTAHALLHLSVHFAITDAALLAVLLGERLPALHVCAQEAYAFRYR